MEPLKLFVYTGNGNEVDPLFEKCSLTVTENGRGPLQLGLVLPLTGQLTEAAFRGFYGQSITVRLAKKVQSEARNPLAPLPPPTFRTLRQFTAFVNGVTLDTTETGIRILRITAAGPLGLLAQRSRWRAFANVTLASLASSLLGNAYEATDEAASVQVDWALQRDETDLHFLYRQCIRFGFSCYERDGMVILLPATVAGHDQEVNFQATVSELDFKFYSLPELNRLTGFDLSAGMVTADATPSADVANPLLNHVRTAASRLLGTCTDYRPGFADSAKLNTELKNANGARTALLLSASGASYRTSLRPGSEVELSAADFLGGTFAAQGGYRISSVTHIFSGGRYKNVFEAIPAGAALLPEAETQRPPGRWLAQVTGVKNDDNLCRVTVRPLGLPAASVTPPLPILRPEQFHGLPTVNSIVLVSDGGEDDNDLLVLGTVYHSNSPAPWAENACGLKHGESGIYIANPSGDVSTRGQNVESIARGNQLIDASGILDLLAP